MTYNVFSGTLNPTHFTSLHVLVHADDVTLMHPLDNFSQAYSALNRDAFAISQSLWPPME